jgi:hypothetical protein
MLGAQQGQGFALDPPKGEGPLETLQLEVQGLGPWRVWAEPNLAWPSHDLGLEFKTTGHICRA